MRYVALFAVVAGCTYDEGLAPSKPDLSYPDKTANAASDAASSSARAEIGQLNAHQKIVIGTIPPFSDPRSDDVGMAHAERERAQTAGSATPNNSAPSRESLERELARLPADSALDLPLWERAEQPVMQTRNYTATPPPVYEFDTARYTIGGHGPDPGVAASDTHVCVTTRRSVTCYDKSGKLAPLGGVRVNGGTSRSYAGHADIRDMFTDANILDPAHQYPEPTSGWGVDAAKDARVIFSKRSQSFFVFAESREIPQSSPYDPTVAGSENARLLVMASRTANPADGWYLYGIPLAIEWGGQVLDAQDFPYIGQTGDRLIIGNRQFGYNWQQESGIWSGAGSCPASAEKCFPCPDDATVPCSGTKTGAFSHVHYAIDMAALKNGTLTDSHVLPIKGRGTEIPVSDESDNPSTRYAYFATANGGGVAVKRFDFQTQNWAEDSVTLQAEVPTLSPTMSSMGTQSPAVYNATQNAVLKNGQLYLTEVVGRAWGDSQEWNRTNTPSAGCFGKGVTNTGSPLFLNEDSSCDEGVRNALRLVQLDLGSFPSSMGIVRDRIFGSGAWDYMYPATAVNKDGIAVVGSMRSGVGQLAEQRASIAEPGRDVVSSYGTVTGSSQFNVHMAGAAADPYNDGAIYLAQLHNTGSGSQVRVAKYLGDTHPDAVGVSLTLKNPGAKSPGETVTVRIKIENRGDEAMPAAWMAYYFSTNSFISNYDSLMRVWYHPALSPGDDVVVERAMTIPTNAPKGTRYIGVQLDCSWNKMCQAQDRNGYHDTDSGTHAEYSDGRENIVLLPVTIK